MEDIRIGSFIRDRRMELGLTQQQLADKLGITDKAVSKWERTVSYPDITILRELAAALEVSVSELLTGEREETPPVPPEVEDVVLDTVSYAETARERNKGWKFWVLVALTAGCLIAVLVLGIVGLACGSVWAAMIVIRAIAFGWAVCYPLLRTERHPVRNAMVIASVFIYPLLWSYGAHRAWHLGVVVVSIAYAWAVYWIWLRYRRQKPMAVTLILLLGVLLHVSINVMVGKGLDGVVVLTGGTLFLEAACLAGAHVAAARRQIYRQRS